MENKTSAAQVKASRKWEENNRKKATVSSYKRTTKLFIRNHATPEDLAELKLLIAEKENELFSK